MAFQRAHRHGFPVVPRDEQRRVRAGHLLHRQMVAEFARRQRQQRLVEHRDHAAHIVLQRGLGGDRHHYSTTFGTTKK